MAKLTQAGLRALKNRYKGQLEEIRASYESKAASELRKLARARESDYKILARQFRHEISVLKRKKVISASVDARKATPTASLSRSLNKLYDLVAGKRRAVKVDRKTAKKLKEEGFEVVNSRAILSPKYGVSKGNVVEKKPRGGGGAKPVTIIRFNENFDEQVDKVFAQLKPDEYVGIDLGNNFSELFMGLEKERFKAYLARYDYRNIQTGMRYVTKIIVRDADVLGYEEERAEGYINRRAKDRARAADRAKRRRGTWIAPRGKVRDGSIPEGGHYIGGARPAKPRKRKPHKRT